MGNHDYDEDISRRAYPLTSEYENTGFRSAPATAALETRIKQLERQCAVLAAEIDLMRPVVEAATYYKRCNPYLPISSSERGLLDAVVDYEAAKEQGNGISTR